MMAVLKLDKDDEKREVIFECDFLFSLSTKERFALMNNKSEIIKRTLLRHGYRKPVEITEAPPAERVGSGGPPEGGDYFGKAPLGLFIHLHQILNPVVRLRPFLAHECNCVWFLHPNQLC